MEKATLTATRSCPHCSHCGTTLNVQSKTMDFVCRLNPPTSAAAFLPGPAGLEVKLVATWPPVTSHDWCSKWQAKLDS